MNSDKTLRLVLGNQLFPISTHNFAENETVFMCEDLGLCSDVKHHKSKIALFFSAMRSFRDELEKNKIDVIYYDYSNDFETDYCEKLIKTISSNGIKKIVFFEIEDKLFEKKVLKSLNKHKIHFEQKTTPMFIDDRDSFNDFCNEKDFLLQANYYKRMRRRLDILMEGKKPVGGKWSFDEQNRKKLPKNYDIPSLPKIKPRDDFKEMSLFIEKKLS
jgi:deoxyribodipyrimidine photolyase-related protein